MWEFFIVILDNQNLLYRTAILATIALVLSSNRLQRSSVLYIHSLFSQVMYILYYGSKPAMHACSRPVLHNYYSIHLYNIYPRSIIWLLALILFTANTIAYSATLLQDVFFSAKLATT